MWDKWFQHLTTSFAAGCSSTNLCHVWPPGDRCHVHRSSTSLRSSRRCHTCHQRTGRHRHRAGWPCNGRCNVQSAMYIEIKKYDHLCIMVVNALQNSNNEILVKTYTQLAPLWHVTPFCVSSAQSPGGTAAPELCVQRLWSQTHMACPFSISMQDPCS